FDNVLVATAQIGYDGLYAVGVAGIFVDCDYVRVAKTTTSPIDEEPLPPDALVKLGWLTADGAAKQRLAPAFVVDVLLNVASPQLQATPDFGATFTGDDGKVVHTPAFAGPTAALLPDGSVTVDVWVQAPGTMASTAGDTSRYQSYRYTIARTGEVTVAA